MVQVLAHLLRRGHHVPLCDPLLQLLHLSAEQEVVVGVVQLLPAVLGELLEPGILLVHLALPPDDLLAADREFDLVFNVSRPIEEDREEEASASCKGLLLLKRFYQHSSIKRN